MDSEKMMIDDDAGGGCIRFSRQRDHDDYDDELLPEEVFIKVLSWLPVKSLLRFKCLSKRWLDVISNHPCFIHDLHSQSQSQSSLLFDISSRENTKFGNIHSLFQSACIDIEEEEEGRLVSKFEISSLTNLLYPPMMLPTRLDLVCFKSLSMFHVCNPSTHELIRLPTFIYTHGDSFGFGYVKSTDQYKIVHLINPFVVEDLEEGQYDPTAPTLCRVFTLGMSKDSPFSYASPWAWRDLGNSPYNVKHYQCPALVDGSLHWLIDEERHPQLFTDIEHPLILVFNLESEEFSLIPRLRPSPGGGGGGGGGCPSLDPVTAGKDLQLVELRGLLCLSCVAVDDDTKMDIWMLHLNGKNNNCSSSNSSSSNRAFTFSWVKEYIIDLSTFDGRRPCKIPRTHSSEDGTYYVPRDIQDDGNKVLIGSWHRRSFYYHLQTSSFSEIIWDSDDNYPYWIHPSFSFYKESLRSLRHVLQRSVKFDQIIEVTNSQSQRLAADLDPPIHVVRVFALFYHKYAYGGYITNLTGQFVAIQGKKLDAGDSIEAEAKAILCGLQFARAECIQRIGLVSSAKELVDAIITGERPEKIQRLENILTMITDLLSEFSWAQIFHDRRMSTQVCSQLADCALQNHDITPFCFHEPPDWFLDG